MVLAIGPVHAPTVADLRRLFADLMDDQPGLPLVATIGGGGTFWRAVPPQDRAAHLERMVSAGDDQMLEDVAGYIQRYRPPLSSTLPLSIVVGRESVVVYSTHLLGDGNTFSRMALMIAQADAAGLAELANRASFRTVSSMLASTATAHWREWARRVIGSDESDGAKGVPSRPQAVETSPSVQAEGAADVRSAEAVLTRTQLKALSTWRNTNCRGVSVTAVLASVIYRSLVEQGVPMDGKGLTTLVDLRRYLPADRQSIYGNLAQNVYLEADLCDPAAIASAMGTVIDSARPVPALVADAARARIRRPRRRPPETLGPVRLSLSVMPSLPGVAGLPWVRDAGRRYVGYAYPAGVRGISVFAVHHRDRIELMACFDGRAIQPTAVRSALENVGDAARLLAVPPRGPSHTERADAPKRHAAGPPHGGSLAAPR
jgi:hypothetical protein